MAPLQASLFLLWPLSLTCHLLVWPVYRLHLRLQSTRDPTASLVEPTWKETASTRKWSSCRYPWDIRSRVVIKLLKYIHIPGSLFAHVDYDCERLIIFIDYTYQKMCIRCISAVSIFLSFYFQFEMSCIHLNLHPDAVKNNGFCSHKTCFSHVVAFDGLNQTHLCFLEQSIRNFSMQSSVFNYR